MRTIILTALSLILFSACVQPRQFEIRKVLGELPILPKPVEISSDSSYHVLGALQWGSENTPSIAVESLIQSWEPLHNPEETTTIFFVADSTQAPESYRLEIDDYDIKIVASTEAGHYWGLVTLEQVVRFGMDSTTYGMAIPTGSISDRPVYGYRGMMLDIARHFFDVEEIKQVIDDITRYKINHLHLHLADDQGWRIEIKSWPKLTEIGGSTEVGGGPGGYLTQEDYQEIVAYAAQRSITIVPEIDMPGHTNAALASYAELNCDNQQRDLYTGMQVGFSSLCVDKEITYKFIRDVITEISQMTPGQYFHIGGDESHSTDQEDYLVFVNRARQIVNDAGKIMIGWDETAEANLDERAVVQLWRHTDKAIKGMDKGASVVFSPAHKAYLDMKYDSTTTLGLNWAGLIDIPTAYNWDLADFVDGMYSPQFLGLEAPLWSETVTNTNEVQYMVFPRITAYAEIGWTPKQVRDWDSYRNRLDHHYSWWLDLNINAYRP